MKKIPKNFIILSTNPRKEIQKLLGKTHPLRIKFVDFNSNRVVFSDNSVVKAVYAKLPRQQEFFEPAIGYFVDDGEYWDDYDEDYDA